MPYISLFLFSIQFLRFGFSGPGPGSGQVIHFPQLSLINLISIETVYFKVYIFCSIDCHFMSKKKKKENTRERFVFFHVQRNFSLIGKTSQTTFTWRNDLNRIEFKTGKKTMNPATKCVRVSCCCFDLSDFGFDCQRTNYFFPIKVKGKKVEPD